MRIDWWAEPERAEDREFVARSLASSELVQEEDVAICASVQRGLASDGFDRGPYAGAVGYFGFGGNLDSCITIRTIILDEGKAYVQAGAGVVADSDPEYEYNETSNKAMAIIRGIERAKGL